MKKSILIATFALVITGCANFSTKQYDISYDPTTGKPIRKISTKASSTALWEADSNLTKWKASQTDKSQGAEVGGLGNSSEATNAVNAIRAVFEGIAAGAVKSVAPIPAAATPITVIKNIPGN